MNIQEFREIVGSAFRDENFESVRLVKGGPKVWALPGDDLVRFFSPHELRRPWGFRLNGGFGIEIPALRKWLTTHKPGAAAGIFQTCFVGYYSVNDQVFAELAIDTGQPVPADLWVGLIKDRLCQLPESLDALLAAYRSNREPLGLLASPHEKAAWDFLVKWRDSPDPDLRVPYRLPNGRLVADF